MNLEGAVQGGKKTASVSSKCCSDGSNKLAKIY